MRCSRLAPAGSAAVINRVRSYLVRDGLGPALAKAVTGSAGVRVAGMAFAFLVGVQLARGLGAVGYGEYGLAMSIIALLTVPTEFGLPQLVTREVAISYAQSQWGKLRGVIRWAVRSSMLIAMAVALCLVGWIVFGGSKAATLAGTLMPGVVLVPVVALLSLHSAALRGAQQIVRGQLPEIALRPAFHSLLLFAVPLVLFPLTPAMAMWLGVAAAMMSLAYAHRLLGRVLPPQAFSVKPELTPHHWWSSAIPMAMTEGMRILQSHVLIFFLGAMVSIAEVGVFRVAVSTAAIVTMPSSLFNVVSMPVVARLHATGQHIQLKRMLGMVSAGMLAGVVALSIPFFVAGDRLLGFLFGSEFSASSPALTILCVTAIANAALGVNAALLNMTGHQNRVTLASAIALGVLLVSGPFLIRRYGIMGAAYSNLASISTWGLIMWRDCIRLLGLDTSVFGILRRRTDISR